MAVLRGVKMMDIRHLRYFVSIVDNDFNLSRASQNLYVSQPALSMMITEFENRENIQDRKSVV